MTVTLAGHRPPRGAAEDNDQIIIARRRQPAVGQGSDLQQSHHLLALFQPGEDGIQRPLQCDRGTDLFQSPHQQYRLEMVPEVWRGSVHTCCPLLDVRRSQTGHRHVSSGHTTR